MKPNFITVSRDPRDRGMVGSGEFLIRSCSGAPVTAANFPRGRKAKEMPMKMLRACPSASTLIERPYKRPVRAAALYLLLCCLFFASNTKAGVWTPLDWADDRSLSFITSASVSHSGDFGSAASINAFTFETIRITGGTATFSSPYAGSNFTVGAPAGTLSYDTLSAGVEGTASGNLSTGLIGLNENTPAGNSVTYTLTGLSTNTDYQFYFLSPEWGETGRTGFLDGSDDGPGNIIAVDQSAGSGDKIIKYAYQTGANTSFTMTVTSNTQGFGLHHYGFVNIRSAAVQDVEATDFDVWAGSHELSGGADDDDDGDGLTNREEYAFGLLPDSPSSCNPMLTPLDQSTGKFLYARREAALTGCEYTIWTSTDLLLWTEDTGATQEVIDLWNEIETVEATISSGLLDSPALFVRVKADIPTP